LPDLFVTPKRFRAQLRLLRERGWRTITSAQLARAVLAGRTVGPKRFVITLDDGGRDGYTAAKPIMEDFGMRGTYCVVPGRMHRDWQLSARHLVSLHANGHEIANHSLTHADLPRLGRLALRRQVAGAARRIARVVGERPVSFCYPYGHHDAGVRRAVARTGHLAAYTTVHGPAGARWQRFRWPRVRVSGSTSPRELLARVRPYARGGGAEPRREVSPASDVDG
jgi:peptidoglycan/xylan/chitin deacetylase (PgdA/CDA1 family)